MLLRTATSLALTAMAMTACGSAPARKLPRCEAPRHVPAGERLHEGASPGPLSADSERAAMSAALTGALTELGVTVGYQLTDVTSEADGEESYRVELRRSAEVEAVEVRGARVVHRCVDPADGSVRAWVAVPEAEWLELARVLRGRTALVLECAGAASDLCETPATLAPLRAAASELELDLLPGLRRAGESTEAAGLCEIGVKEGAARVLHVRLDARDDAADYGEHFAWASAHAHLYETRDCTRQRSAAPEEVKGAQFSAAEARKAALARAVERLVEEMRGW